MASRNSHQRENISITPLGSEHAKSQTVGPGDAQRFRENGTLH